MSICSWPSLHQLDVWRLVYRHHTLTARSWLLVESCIVASSAITALSQKLMPRAKLQKQRCEGESGCEITGREHDRTYLPVGVALVSVAERCSND